MKWSCAIARIALATADTHNTRTLVHYAASRRAQTQTQHMDMYTHHAHAPTDTTQANAS